MELSNAAVFSAVNGVCVCVSVKSVCKLMAMRAYKRGRLGAALTWCIRGKVSDVKLPQCWRLFFFCSKGLPVCFLPGGEVSWVNYVTTPCIIMCVCGFHRYMESFDSLGEFMDLDLLDHLGDAMLLSDRLMFLGNPCPSHFVLLILTLPPQPSTENTTCCMSEGSW